MPANLERVLQRRQRHAATMRRRRERERVERALRAAVPPTHAERAPGPSVLGNWFLPIDGEGVGDDYVMLDSVLESVPRLYFGGRRLGTTEILDWLWQLHRTHGYAQFVIYGAGYDFNNWLRDVAPTPANLKLLSEGKFRGRVGAYQVQWLSGYAFQVYKPLWKDGKAVNQRVALRRPDGRVRDLTRLTVYDVQPFWQESFVKALDRTLGAEVIEPELIEWGKAKRGEFTPADFETAQSQGTRYNKAELQNLAALMLRLDDWFNRVGLRVRSYNGPGAVAKAKLAQERLWVHMGRHYPRERSDGTFGDRRLRPRVGLYTSAPGEVLHAALHAFSAGRIQCWRVGTEARGQLWDINSAYPAQTARLPCMTHGYWQRAGKFEPRSFGLWEVSYSATKRLPSYPFFWRSEKGAILYPARIAQRWAHTAEVLSAIKADGAGVTIRQGYVWRPKRCPHPYPLDWVTALYRERQAAEARGDMGAVLTIKLILNSLYGSFIQGKGGTPFEPPWTQQVIWGGAVTAGVRAQLYDAAMLDPDGVMVLATDGILTRRELPLQVAPDKALGGWSVKEYEHLLVYMAGRWFADGVTKSRGYDSDTLTREEVLKAWRQRKETVMASERRFHTLGLVANGQTPEKWCTWRDVPLELNIQGSNLPFTLGAGVSQLARIARVKNATEASYPTSDQTFEAFPMFPPSAIYDPKWTIGEDAPPWLSSDLLDDAREVAVNA